MEPCVVAATFQSREKSPAAGYPSLAWTNGAYMANELSLSCPDVFDKAFICDSLEIALRQASPEHQDHGPPRPQLLVNDRLKL